MLRTAVSVDPTKNPRTEDEYHCKTRFSVIYVDSLRGLRASLLVKDLQLIGIIFQYQ